MRILVIIVIVLLASALFPVGCGKEDNSTSTPDVTIETGQADQVTSQAHIYLYKAGQKTTDLIASELKQYSKLDSTVAIDLFAKFFDSTGAMISTLKADSGYIREKQQFLAVTGNVAVINDDSLRLETSYLEWDAGNERVVTDSFVEVIREGDTLRSYGLITDPHLDSISFKRQVSGRLTDIEKVKNDKK